MSDPREAPARRPWPPIGSIAASLGLLLWLWCTAFPLRGLSVLMAATNCGPEEDPQWCFPTNVGLVVWAPVYAAEIGLVVALVGCWIWPRRHRELWLTIGYSTALLGYAVAIAFGAPEP